MVRFLWAEIILNDKLTRLQFKPTSVNLSGTNGRLFKSPAIVSIEKPGHHHFIQQACFA